MKKPNNFQSEYVHINGIDQYLLHYSIDAGLPVLLFLHGGPGMAESTFAYTFQEGLTNLYSVVYWDQRGAGKTLTKTKGKSEYPSVEDLLADLFEVVQYLKKKYHKEKIVILGHSWGSMLGTLFARKYPEEVLYYIGAGQFIDILENEKIGYEKVKELIVQSGNKKDLESLKKIGVYPERNYEKPMIRKIQQVRILQGKYKIGMDFMPIIKALLKSPIFQLSDMSSLFKGMSNNKRIWDYLFTHNLHDEHSTYDIPVFYILGDRDFQAPNTVASRYFDEIQAPYKRLFMIEDAGHFMMLDQPKRFADALAEIRGLSTEGKIQECRTI